MSKHAIPEKHIEFCKAVAAICREHKMDSCTLTYRPRIFDDWTNLVTMQWEQGRHGEDSNRLHVSSTANLNTTIDVPKP